MDIEHCLKHSIRHSIDCSDQDVVEAFKLMSEHWPSFSPEELADRFDGNPHPIFLRAKLNFKIKDRVWFQKRAVGKNTLGKAVRTLIESTPGIVIGDHKFTNQTPRRMEISRMAEVQIPTDKGMLVTGQRNMDTCQRIISGDAKKYFKVLSQEVKKASVKNERGVVKVENTVKIENIVKVENALKVEDGFQTGLHRGVAPNVQAGICKRKARIMIPKKTEEVSPSLVGGFVFGSASGCNFYSFNGSFDSNFVTSFISKLSKVDSPVAAPASAPVSLQ